MPALDIAKSSHNSRPALDLPPELPDGCELQSIAYVVGDQATGTTLLKFTQPVACRAVLTCGAADADVSVDESVIATLGLLLVPCDEQEGAELTAAAWDWVEPGVAIDRRQGLMITLQGARVVWASGRAALVAAADRLPSLRLAIAEFAFHEAEVAKIEQTVAAAWPELERDGPLAFHFDERAAPEHERLGRRFEQVLGLRMRLARIDPLLHSPPVHPPTLAGQLTERFKERRRLAERIEFLSDQLDVFEGVYEKCGQLSNDFFLARKQITLEWVIIVLLAAETIVLLITLLAAMGQ